MPAVLVSWNGQCPDRAAQQKLCAKIAGLGVLSGRLYSDFFGVKVKQVRFDGRTLPGKALFMAEIFGKEVIPASLEQVEEGIYAGERIGLYGTEFPLFDPRRYGSPLILAHQEKLSFVFVRSDDPELDGWIVRMQKLGCKNRRSFENAESCLLLDPDLELCGCLESWIGDLLGWVKRFYMPDVNYWAWVNNPGYSRYTQILPDDLRARDEIYLNLREDLIREAIAWQALYLKGQTTRIARPNVGSSAGCGHFPGWPASS